MKKIFTSLLAMAAIASVSMTADAFNVTLVSPKEGDVSNPGHFPNIILKVGDAYEQSTTVTMKSESGEEVTCGWEFDTNAWGMSVNCANVTKSGKWSLTLPAGILDAEGDKNEEVTFSWNYINTAGGEVSTFDLNVFALDGNYSKVQPGGDITNDSYFPNVNINMGAYGSTIDKNLEVKLTSDKGLSSTVSVNSMFYDMGYDMSVLIMCGDLEAKESGKYTLIIPEGLVTNDAGAKNNAAEFSWNYTNSSQSGPDTPTEELKVTSFTVGGINILGENVSLATIKPGDAIDIAITPIENAAMIVVSFDEKESGENIRSFEIYNNPFNEDITADPAKGTYSSKAGGDAVNKFYTGTDYTVTLTAYSTNNIGNPANEIWGPVSYEFTGATEPYKFSTATLISVSPEDGAEVNDPTQPVVFTFSDPVNVTRVEASTGGQDANIVNLLSNTEPNADKTVWTVKPGKSFWETSENDWMFDIYATGEDGLVVKGNRGEDAGSYNEVIIGCYLAYPAVDIQPASGMVEELYSFTIEESAGVSLSYNYIPYVVNEAGETVAKVDMDSQIQYDSTGRDITTIEGGSDIKAVKAVFHLDKAITTPGKYKLISPRSSYALGTEFNAWFNRYMETDYTVVKLPKVAVSVELVNFANVSFEVLKGKDATVSLTPSADWKVASLTLNDKDVTAEVADNAYTIKSVQEDAKLVATYEYAHEVQIVETSGIVEVEGKEVSVSNEGENIVIAGLANGDVVKVYTVNGMTIANHTAAEEIAKISCPNGQIYVVTINNTAFKIKH